MKRFTDIRKYCTYHLHLTESGGVMSGRKAKRNKIFNILMAALIVFIVFCGFMTVGTVKGWFGESESSYAVSSDISGIVNVQRNNVAYSLQEKTEIKSEDIIETKSESSAGIKIGKNTYDLSENTEVCFEDIESKKSISVLNCGQLFAVINKHEEFGSVYTDEFKVASDNAVFSADRQTGSASINVFEGKITVSGKQDSADKVTAESGEKVSIQNGKIAVGKLDEKALNDFNIEKAKEANDGGHKLCFSNKELEKVISDREKETKKIAEEKEAHEKQIIAAGEKGVSSSSGGGASSGSEDVKSCTIQIRCDDILKNMGSLKAGKEKFVPKNGIILASSSVEFRQGDTGFDVLKRACSAAGIQLEYSYTPMYGSYYIEGINNIYEFDCGSRSGWMYRVNGWSPNYGSSSYEMKDGDVIVWSYTCSGM
ncbi:MAG: DUF4430 domain-containing protein [Anaerovoracaceae bacterium]